MKNVIPTTYLPDECYVIEVDGKIKSKHGAFIEALKAGLELKQKFPQGEIRVHDANANARMPRAAGTGQGQQFA